MLFADISDDEGTDSYELSGRSGGNTIRNTFTAGIRNQNKYSFNSRII